MYTDDLKIIKQRIYDEELVEQILEDLECEYIKLRGNRYEAGLPNRFGSRNHRSVQVYLTESLSSKIRSKGISGDIYTLVGYILYEVDEFEDLKDYLHQVKTYICNLFNWNEYLEIRDDFEEKIERKDHLSFIRDIQKRRKQRKRNHNLQVKENKILEKESAFSRFVKLPHKNFLDDGINLKTQREFEVMFDMESERVVFPIYNSNGDLVSVKGRYVGSDKWIMDEIKYLYLHNFDKSIELFNLHRALSHIKKTGEVIVFESEKSCMKAHQYGFYNTVGIMGNELSPIQAFLLKRLEVNIVFAFDNDIELDHIKKQARQIKTRKCFYLKDNSGRLGEKSAPVDEGVEVWERIYEGGLTPVE